MKTTITRYDVHLFERLVSKLFKSSDVPQTVAFAPCTAGLQHIAFGSEAVLCMTTPMDESVEPFTLPWAAIKELATKKREPVQLDAEGDSVSVTYSLGGVPQHRTFPSLGLTDKRVPNVPDNTVAYPVTMFDALADAGKCVDPDNGRYALGSICLRGSKAQIISTDGRQALMQDGYTFPWDDDVLCPVSKIYSSKEIREFGDMVQVGIEDGWIMFEIGTVKLWLKQIDGKFPQLDQFTKHIDHFTWLNIDPSDAAFAMQRLENLPGKTDRESPIYVELFGRVAVRGHDQIQQAATELHLTRSRYDGKSLTMPMNRRFLKNALGFGINRLGFDPEERTPLVGYGDRKTFVVMPLEADEPKVEPGKLTVLASDATLSVLPKSAEPVQRSRRTKPTTENVVAPSVCRQVKSIDKPKTKAQVLEEAEKLRQTLRESLIGVNGLIREIKAQRRQDKLLRDTVASLRKLQGV